jgi:hypothetical protein
LAPSIIATSSSRKPPVSPTSAHIRKVGVRRAWRARPPWHPLQRVGDVVRQPDRTSCDDTSGSRPAVSNRPLFHISRSPPPPDAQTWLVVIAADATASNPRCDLIGPPPGRPSTTPPAILCSQCYAVNRMREPVRRVAALACQAETTWSRRRAVNEEGPSVGSERGQQRAA